MPSSARIRRALLGLLVALWAMPLAAQQSSASKKTTASKATTKSGKASSGKATTRKRTTTRRPAPRPPELPVRAASDDSAAAREARAAFERYTEAFNAGRDLDAMAFYSDDSRFHWVEDGRTAYISSGMIRESVAQVRKLFPTMVFEPGEVRTTVFGRDAVQLTVPFVQRLVDGGGVESKFEGAMTVALTKASGSWRALSGHTSLRRAAAR